MYNKEEPNKNVFLHLGNKLGRQLHTEFCDGPCDKEITRNQRLEKFIFKKSYGSHDFKKGDLCDFVVNTSDYIKDEVNEAKRQKLMNKNLLEGLNINLPNKLARDSYNYSKLVIDLVDYINKIITFKSKFTPKSKWIETNSNKYVPQVSKSNNYVNMTTPPPKPYIYEDEETNNSIPMIKPTRHIYEDEKSSNNEDIYENSRANNVYTNIGIVSQPPIVRPSSTSNNNRTSDIGIYYPEESNTKNNTLFTSYFKKKNNNNYASINNGTEPYSTPANIHRALNNGDYAYVEPISNYPSYLRGEPRKFTKKKSTRTPPQLPTLRQSQKSKKNSSNMSKPIRKNALLQRLANLRRKKTKKTKQNKGTLDLNNQLSESKRLANESQTHLNILAEIMSGKKPTRVGPTIYKSNNPAIQKLQNAIVILENANQNLLSEIMNSKNKRRINKFKKQQIKTNIANIKRMKKQIRLLNEKQ